MYKSIKARLRLYEANIAVIVFFFNNMFVSLPEYCTLKKIRKEKYILSS